MSWQQLVQALVLVVLLAATVPFLGRYMADVYGARGDGTAPGDRFFGPIERTIYRWLGVDAKREQRWNVYAVSLVAFSLVSVLVLYALHRLQGVLPFNPTDRPGVSPMGSFNAAISFVTNTNWQWYSGELSISNLTNMLGNTVQNFVSAAAGMVVAIALIRGITRTGSRLLGNFWVDLVRTLLRILLPLTLVFAVVLISQGVIQNLGDGVVAVTVDQTPLDSGDPATAISQQVEVKQHLRQHHFQAEECDYDERRVEQAQPEPAARNQHRQHHLGALIEAEGLAARSHLHPPLAETRDEIAGHGGRADRGTLPHRMTQRPCHQRWRRDAEDDAANRF